MSQEIKTPRKYRFSFHYFRQKRCASVHFRGACHIAKDVKIITADIDDIETKHRARQPYWVVQGFCKKVEIKRGIAVIS
jgi:hypothetical protein